MTEQQEAEFVEQAFEKLKERGWFADQELERSTVTEEEIAAFEAKHQVTLPSLYKAYLMSYRIPDREYIMSIAEDPNRDWEYSGGPLWLDLRGAVMMEELENWMEIFQQIRDYCDLPEESFRYLIPIGDWGAGWGPLCLDLSREGKVTPKTWIPGLWCGSTMRTSSGSRAILARTACSTGSPPHRISKRCWSGIFAAPWNLSLKRPPALSLPMSGIRVGRIFDGDVQRLCFINRKRSFCHW